MERLLGILLAPLYLAVNGYILWRFLAWLAACAPALGRRPVRACLGLSYFLLCATPLAGFLLPAGPVQRAVKLAGNIWLGCLLYILLFLAAADLTALAVRRRKGRPATAQGKARARRLFAAWGGAVAAVTVAVSTYGAVHFGQIRTTYYTAQVPKACAAGDGLRVALASDLHLGASVGTRQLARMVRRVNDARPDVVVLAAPLYYWTISGQLKLAFDRLFAVAECDPNLANPKKESVLLMAAEGHGFEETLYWYDHLEQHLGWKSLGRVLCGGVMNLGDIAGREELHQAFELGRSIS